MKTRSMKFLVSSLALFACFISLVSWSAASAPGSSPDDNFHMASTWCAWGDADGICESEPGSKSKWVPEQIPQSTCFAFHPEASAKCSELHTEGAINGMILFAHGNYNVHSYPGLTYAVERLFVDSDFESSVLRIRIFNSFLFVVLLFWLWNVVAPGKKKIVFWMWAGSLVPLGMFMISSVNPSSWAIMGVPTAWLALDAYFDRNNSKKISSSILFFTAVFVSAGARGDSALYVGLSIFAALILNFRSIRVNLKLLLIPIVGGVLGVLAFLSSTQSNVASTGLYDGGLTADWSLAEKIQLLLSNIVQLPALWAGSFGMSGIGEPAVAIGNLGWLDTAMPMMTWLPALAVFISLGFTGLSYLNKEKLLAVTAVTFALVCLPLYVLQKSYAGVGAQVQPRYLLPLIALLLGILLYGSSDEFTNQSRLNRTQISILVGALFVANSLALFYVVRRFVTGTDVKGGNLNTSAEWWWTVFISSPQAIWIMGSLAFIAALVCGINILSRQAKVMNSSLGKP